MCGPLSFALMKSFWLPERASQPVQQPPARRERAVLSLPLLDVLDLQQEVGWPLPRPVEVEHDGRRDQTLDRHRRDVVAVLAGDPMGRGVEVGAGVLARAEVVPVPRWAVLVVAADLLSSKRCVWPNSGGSWMIGVSVDSGAVRSITSIRPDETAATKSASVDMERMIADAGRRCHPSRCHPRQRAMRLSRS